MPDGERRLHVLAEVELLQRDRIGLVRDDQRIELGVQLGEAPLAREFGGGLDHAAGEREQPPAAAFDDAVSGVREAGVDSEHDHGE